MPSVNSNKTAGCKEQKEKTNDGSAFRLNGGDMGDKTFNEHQGHCTQISRGPKNCKKGTQWGPSFEQKGDQMGTFLT